MKTIETLRNICKENRVEYRNMVKEMQDMIKAFDSTISEAVCNGQSVRDSVKAFVKQVGKDAATVVVASLVNRNAWDGRISSRNAEWAKGIEDAWDDDAMLDQCCYCKAHTAHLDQFADYMRKDIKEIVAEIEAETEREIDGAVAEEVQKEMDAEQRRKEINKVIMTKAWNESKNAEYRMLGVYDYTQKVMEDVLEYIRDNEPEKEYTDREYLEEALNEELWVEDSVTGNGSGSYTFSGEKAKLYVHGNTELIRDMVDEFGIGAAEIGERFMNEDWEWFDVSLRCYVLGQAIHSALDLVEGIIFGNKAA